MYASLRETWHGTAAPAAAINEFGYTSADVQEALRDIREAALSMCRASRAVLRDLAGGRSEPPQG